MIEYSTGCLFYPVAPGKDEIKAGDAVSFDERGQLVRAVLASDGIAPLPESAELLPDGMMRMSIDDYERMLLQMFPPGRRL